jgi:hypothetical protein
MSTATRSTVSDVTGLREIAAGVRAVAKRGGGEADASLEAIAAEMEITAEQSAARDGGEARGRAHHIGYLDLKVRQLRWMAWTVDTLRSAELLKLAKELEDHADGLIRPVRALAGAGGLLARKALWVRFAPVAVATVIGLAAVIWSGDRWLFSRGDSQTIATATALVLPVPAAPALPTEEVTVPPPVMSTERPPPQPEMAVLATRLAAEIVATQRRVAKLEAPSEPKPRRTARAAAPAGAPPAVRELDLSRGARDDDAPPSPAVDAATVPSPDQAPAAPGARQAALPPAIRAPVSLLATAPAKALGDAAEPSPTAGTSAPSQRECIPYSSDTTMSGRSEPVQGLACRDANGTWRRMSEVPRPDRGP